MLAAERDQFLGELGTGIDAGHQLHHRFDFLAEIGVRHSKYRRVGDLGMGDQQELSARLLPAAPRDKSAPVEGGSCLRGNAMFS